MVDVSRNAPCPCGSGLKYKKCCMKTGGVHRKRRLRQAQWLVVAAVVAALAVGVLFGTGAGLTVAGLGALAAGALVFFSDPPSSRSGGSPGAINFGN